MNLNSLTKCRAYLTNALAEFSPVPVRDAGNLTAPPARLYVEVNINGPKTNPTIDAKFNLTLLVIAIPPPTDNFFQYVDIAHQFQRYLNGLFIIIPDVGCLMQDGTILVKDLGYVDRVETIRQAKVLCEFILEY